MAERLKAADLKSVDVKASVGSNPTSSAIYEKWRSLVAHLVWDQRAAGSNPVFSTIFNCRNSVTVARDSPKVFVTVQILLAVPLFMHL